jgi:hypothetical protein
MLRVIGELATTSPKSLNSRAGTAAVIACLLQRLLARNAHRLAN